MSLLHLIKYKLARYGPILQVRHAEEIKRNPLFRQEWYCSKAFAMWIEKRTGTSLNRAA